MGNVVFVGVVISQKPHQGDQVGRSFWTDRAILSKIYIQIVILMKSKCIRDYGKEAQKWSAFLKQFAFS